MENSLFYTFSTVAQVLASFVALSGAFVIFKIQELKNLQLVQAKYFYNYSNNLANNSPYSSFHDCPSIVANLKTLHESNYLGGMSEEMKKILQDESVSKTPEFEHLEKIKDKFDNVDVFRRKIICSAKVSAITGIFTIFFSLFVLARANWVIQSNYTCCTYIFGFLGLAASILTMTYIIFLSLGEKIFQDKDVIS